MKSILLTVPKMNGPNGDFILNTHWDREFNNLLQQKSWNVVTPSILLLAAIAQEEGYEVSIADEFFREIDTSVNYDIVCFYTVTPNVKRAYSYARIFKEKGSFIAMGGVHTTFCREEAKDYCDTILIGEGEVIFREFLQDYASGQAKSRYIQVNSGKCLEESPTPLFGLLNKKERRLIPMQTARGCSHNCKFCNVRSLYGNIFRSKNLMQIDKELDVISSLDHVGNLYLTDDNILSDTDHFYNLLDLLGNNTFKWYANADISFGQNSNSIRAAYRSGLRQVLIGLESISRENLKGIDKDNFKYRYLPKYKENIQRIQSHGIGITGSFIVGQEGDTEETFKYLEEFIYDTKLFGANITIYTPYPGTALYQQLDRHKKIETYNWDYYTIFQPVIKMRYLSSRHLNEKYKELITIINSKEFIQNKLNYFAHIYKEKSK